MNRNYILNQLIYNTFRIESTGVGGVSPSTGYCVNLWTGDPSRMRPVIIGCRHAIQPFEKIAILFRKMGSDGLPENGEPERIEVETNQRNLVLFHPDPSIDLACINIAPILNVYERAGIRIFQKHIPLEFIATEEDEKNLNVGDDVVLVGYPNGFWDSKNNLPVVKKGCISTPPEIDFEGKSEFIIDIAMHPGSSGGPVFSFNLHNHIHHFDRQQIEFFPKLKLVGTIYFGQRTNLMLGSDDYSVYDQQIAHVLKTKLLLDFIPLLDRINISSLNIFSLPESGTQNGA